MQPFEGIPNNQTELRTLFDEDQQDREKNLNKTDPVLFTEREKVRYQKAQEIFARYEQNPQSLSAQDMFHLAFLFQHGQTSEDYNRAYILALAAEKRGVEDAKWLSAAAEDRWLISLGKSQKWGTQFIQTEKGWQYAAPVEDDGVSGITDEIRQSKNVPAKDSQLQKIAEIYPESLSGLDDEK